MASVSRVVSPVASDLEPVPIKKIVLTGKIDQTSLPY